MATQDTARNAPPNVYAAKRKFVSESNDQDRKKRRATAPRQTQDQTQNRTQHPTPPANNYNQIYSPLLVKLNRKFEVKAMSVMPSTVISKHVDRALEHLGRFHAWDQTVLPGAVLLCARSTACAKLITIAEIIRRRIGESEQKWFQYNLLSETAEEVVSPPDMDISVVEETVMGADRGNEDEEEAEDDDDYFETMGPRIHERAVQRTKVRYKAHITILLSRVPLDELKNEKNVSLQTNEQHIEYLWKKRSGLVG